MVSVRSFISTSREAAETANHVTDRSILPSSREGRIYTFPENVKLITGFCTFIYSYTPIWLLWPMTCTSCRYSAVMKEVLSSLTYCKSFNGPWPVSWEWFTHQCPLLQDLTLKHKTHTHTHTANTNLFRLLARVSKILLFFLIIVNLHVWKHLWLKLPCYKTCTCKTFMLWSNNTIIYYRLLTTVNVAGPILHLKVQCVVCRNWI